MDKIDIGKDPASECKELSSPLPEPVVLGTSPTKAVAGGFFVGDQGALGGEPPGWHGVDPTLGGAIPVPR